MIKNNKYLRMRMKMKKRKKMKMKNLRKRIKKEMNNNNFQNTMKVLIQVLNHLQQFAEIAKEKEHKTQFYNYPIKIVVIIINSKLIKYKILHLTKN